MSSVDQHIDAVLRAAGSSLRHYTMQMTRDRLRAAMSAAIDEELAIDRASREMERSQSDAGD